MLAMLALEPGILGFLRPEVRDQKLWPRLLRTFSRAGGVVAKQKEPILGHDPEIRGRARRGRG